MGAALIAACLTACDVVAPVEPLEADPWVTESPAPLQEGALPVATADRRHESYAAMEIPGELRATEMDGKVFFSVVSDDPEAGGLLLPPGFQAFRDGTSFWLANDRGERLAQSGTQISAGGSVWECPTEWADIPEVSQCFLVSPMISGENE